MTAVGERNLGLLAQRSFERRGDYPALLFEGRWHRSGELFSRSQRLAAGLAELGVAPGDRVVVCMANCPEVSIAYQALWLAGAVVTPATFLLPAPDLRHVIANAEARAVITTPEFFEKVTEATGGLEHVRFVIGTNAVDDGVLDLAELERAEPRPIVPRSDDDLAALLYTGGTTGRAKGVMLSHANLFFSGGQAHDAAHVPGVNRQLTTLPLSHAYGLLVTIAAMHNAEQGINVLLRWFDPATYLRLIGEHRLQLSAVVPTMLQILLGMPLEDYDLSTLLWLSSGGAPLAPEVEQEFCRRVPSVSIRQGYGLTESAALISTNPTGAVRSGSVGRPVPGTEMEIRDPEGRAVPPGEAGEVSARSPGVMQGYWRAPKATSEALDDGWLRTGDIGYLDADGYLLHRGPQEGPDHPRRLQRLPPRRRGRARPAPRRPDGGRRRPRLRAPRRRGGRIRQSRARRRGHRRGAGRVGPGAHRRLQVSARGAPGRRDSAHSGRQDRPQGGPGPRGAGAVSPRADRLSRAAAGPRARAGSARPACR